MSFYRVYPKSVLDHKEYLLTAALVNNISDQDVANIGSIFNPEPCLPPLKQAKSLDSPF
ncbi:MAG: hypothetical protein QM666_06915 [Acinetobacter sp.]